jgi:hypothetical protein
MNQEIIIGCDIGGVVRDNYDKPINHSIETLREISLNDQKYKLIFISKCKDHQRILANKWLKMESMDHVPIFFCYDYKEKLNIALRENVSIMIDDRIQVLSLFSEHPRIMKIWFCQEEKKINGTKKYQPDLFDSLTLARNWSQVAYFIQNYGIKL